jgi:hypothetical protein
MPLVNKTFVNQNLLSGETYYYKWGDVREGCILVLLA